MLAIDHFVFPVSSLEAMRGFMERMGFTVAPKAIHPFGTANICLFLKDNVYVEFLARHDEEIYAQALNNEYSFIRDMDNWCRRNGDDGFSGLAFASNDGHGDYARFEAAGIAGGRIGEFSREFSLPDGTTDIASFRTAHTNLPSMQDIVCFTCQRVRTPAVDRSALEIHVNGVEGIKKIIIAAPEPMSLRQDLTALLDTPPSLAVPDLLGFDLPNVSLIALTCEQIAKIYGITLKFPPNTPRLVGLEIKTSSLAQVEAALTKGGISYNLPQDEVLVHHHPIKNADIFWAFSVS